MTSTQSNAQDVKRAAAIARFTNLVKEACEEFDLDVDGCSDVETRKLFAKEAPEVFVSLRNAAGLKVSDDGKVVAA